MKVKVRTLWHGFCRENLTGTGMITETERMALSEKLRERDMCAGGKTLGEGKHTAMHTK